MGDLWQIVLTSVFTIVGGVVIFVIGQLSVRFVIDPIHDLKHVLTEIQFALIYHAQALHTPAAGDEKRCDEAAKVIRRLAADLRARVQSIPIYGSLSRIWRLPDRSSCRKAVSQLIGLSNSLHEADRSKDQARVDRAGRLLGFEQLEE